MLLLVVFLDSLGNRVGFADGQAISAQLARIAGGDDQAIRARAFRREDDARVEPAARVVVLGYLALVVILDAQESVEVLADQIERVGLARFHLEFVRMAEALLALDVEGVGLRNGSVEGLDDLAAGALDLFDARILLQ